MTYINAADWDTARAIVEEHPELMSVEALTHINQMLEVAEAENNLQLAHHVVLRRNTLREAQERGLSAAFAQVMEAPDEALIDVVVAFVNADGWEASRKVLESNPMLMSPQAERAMDNFIQQALQEDRTDLAYQLSMHLDVLRSAKEVGYDEAFDRINRPPDEAMAKLIAEFVNVGDLQAARAFINEHPELLTNEGDATFDVLVQAALAAGEANQSKILTAYRDLLRAGRRMGVDAAFEHIEQAQVEDDPARAEVVVQVVVQNTVGVLLAEPAGREAWAAEIAELRVEAERIGDVQMAALTAAVGRLLAGEKIVEITPALAGNYAAGWAQITAALKAEL